MDIYEKRRIIIYVHIFNICILLFLITLISEMLKINRELHHYILELHNTIRVRMRLYHDTLWYNAYCDILGYSTKFGEKVKTELNYKLPVHDLGSPNTSHHIIFIIQQTNRFKQFNSKIPLQFIWTVSANYWTHWFSCHNIKMTSEISMHSCTLTGLTEIVDRLKLKVWKQSA